MKKIKILIMIITLFSNQYMEAQENKELLNSKEQSIVQIAALTATGDIKKLEEALHEGLRNGLTINQINDELAQLYAYCGFPRSLNGIVLFMKVVEERKKSGINDVQGEKMVSLSEKDRYELGRKTLEQITKTKQLKPAPGFGEFNPIIDRFLKEHLFADIFESNLFTYKQRELITISALSVMAGVDSQLQAHIGIGINTGISENEIVQILGIAHKITQPEKENNNSLNIFLKYQVEHKDNTDFDSTKNNLVRISEIKIFPEYFDEYITILKEESAASINKEPGVIAIFPLVEKENPTKIKILEFYKNQEAYKAHILSEHFQYYKVNTMHMVKELKLLDMYVIDASSMIEIFKKLK